MVPEVIDEERLKHWMLTNLQVRPCAHCRRSSILADGALLCPYCLHEPFTREQRASMAYRAFDTSSVLGARAVLDLFRKFLPPTPQ